MNYFEEVIADLREKKSYIENKISLNIEDKTKLIIEKEKIKHAIYWLSLIENLEIEKCKIEKSIKIPDIGYCDLRLVLDPESDNPKLWSEYKINDKPVILNTGDIVFQIKK